MREVATTFDSKKGDVIFIVSDKKQITYDALGFLRVHIAREMNLLRDDEYDFLWVVDFPLFEMDEKTGNYTAMHHPFTSPKREDLDLLERDPGSVRARAYDIVLNGVELGGGSIRIHERELQERMFAVPTQIGRASCRERV